MRELSARIDAILKRQGMSQGSVGARIHALYQDPKYRFEVQTNPNRAVSLNVLLTSGKFVQFDTHDVAAPVEVVEVTGNLEARVQEQ